MPDSYIARLKGVPKDKVAAEGIRSRSSIHECLAMKGIAGIHLMAIEWEENVPEILEAADLLPAPRWKRIKQRTVGRASAPATMCDRSPARLL